MCKFIMQICLAGLAAVIPGSVAAQSSATGLNVVVAGLKPISKDVAENLRKKPVDALSAELVKEKYFRVEYDGRLFFFSPDLWAGDAFKALDSAYTSLSESLGNSGMLSGDKSQGVKDLLGSTFGDFMHFDQSDRANYKASSMGVVWLTDGSKTVPVRLMPDVKDQDRAQLQKSPLRHQANSSPAPASPPKMDFQLPIITQLSTEVFGPGVSDPAERAIDIGDVGLLIKQHYTEEHDKLEADFNKLKQKIKDGYGQDVLGKLERGMEADQMPEPLKSRISEQLVSNWKSGGFGSEDDAKSFLMRSQVRGTWSCVMLIAAQSAGGGFSLSYFGIPNP